MIGAFWLRQKRFPSLKISDRNLSYFIHQLASRFDTLFSKVYPQVQNLYFILIFIYIPRIKNRLKLSLIAVESIHFHSKRL